MKAAVLLLAALSTGAVAHAQDYLNCHLVPGWEQSGIKRQYTADNLFDYKDGGAEGYLIFGFVRMEGITCASGADTLDIDVYEMNDADSAYGLFTSNSNSSLPIAKIGMAGQIQRQSATFAKGKFFVEIAEVASNPASDQTPTMQAFVTGIEHRIEGRETPPETLDWFPKEDLTSARLVPESVLGLRPLKRGYVAKYKQGQAFIVPEASPEAAADILKQLRNRFPDASPAQIADQAFQAKAPYLGGICFFRKGRYLGGYANLPDPQQAASLAAKLAARLP